MTDPLEIQADAWMKQFAAIDDREHILPDPSVIWLKARVMQSVKEAERASRPVNAMQIAAYAAVAACWTALLSWKWSVIQSWLESLRPTNILISGATAAPSSSMMSAPFFVTLLVLASVTVALAMHTIFVEE
jgi:hypothetical protein